MRPAEENLDDAASEGAVAAVVPLLKKLNGGDELAQEQPTTRCVCARVQEEVLGRRPNFSTTGAVP